MGRGMVVLWNVALDHRLEARATIVCLLYFVQNGLAHFRSADRVAIACDVASAQAIGKDGFDSQLDRTCGFGFTEGKT